MLPGALFLGIQEGRNSEKDVRRSNVLYWSWQKYSFPDCFSRLFSPFINPVTTCCSLACLQHAASCLHLVQWKFLECCVRENTPKLQIHRFKSSFSFCIKRISWILFFHKIRRNGCLGLCQSSFYLSRIYLSVHYSMLKSREDTEVTIKQRQAPTFAILGNVIGGWSQSNYSRGKHYNYIKGAQPWILRTSPRGYPYTSHPQPQQHFNLTTPG